jgi:hypothetical protein
MTTTTEIRESKSCNICNSEKHQPVYSWSKDHYDHEKYETASWDGRLSLDLQIVKCA